MTDMFDLEKRYENTLKDAKKFLENKKEKAKTRSNLSRERVTFLVNSNAECPLCGVRFEGANHNTEHVYPIGLGGVNVLQNKIQICVLCNGARNQVMQAILGHPPYRKNYPENWTNVKRFLIWCNISIDDPPLAQTITPTIQQKFMEFRTGGETFPLSPKRAFGRASKWKVGDEPNYEFNRSSNCNKNVSKSIKSKSSRSLGIRLFDRIFGYNTSKENKPPKQTKRVLIDNTQLIEEISEEELAKNFPKIKGFNTSSRSGLRLPEKPSEFAEGIILYMQIKNQIQSTDELNEAFKQLFTRLRRDKIIMRIASVVFPYDESIKLKDRDWRKATANDDPLQIIQNIKLRFDKSITEFRGVSVSEDSLRQLIDSYFEQVMTYLNENEKYESSTD